MANECASRPKGYRIVLTASRAEMSQYGSDPFRAFICTFPEFFSRRVLNQYLGPETNPDGISRFAPLGLRKVESILVSKYGRDAVAISHPDELHKVIGEDTKVLGITSMDPVGLAYVSTTYNSLIGFGGESLNSVEFRDMLNQPVIKKFKPKIIVGGAGVWQIRDSGMQEKLGIDVLFQGEGEDDIIPVFEKLLSNERLDPYHYSSEPDRSKIPQIIAPSMYGAVEITRGCGRGCAFCSPTNRTKHSFPLENIMEEVELNVKGGARSIFTVTEDMFLYKSFPGFKPNTPEIVKLYKSIADYPGVNHILLSHASFAPVLYDKTLLDQLTPILMEKTYWTTEKGYKQDYITVEVGIETGSSRLMNKFMKGKALPFSVDNWSDLVLQGVATMNDHDWWPLCTIMTGQPDENEQDVKATLDLLDDLRAQNAKMFYTPVLFIPLEEALLNKEKRASLYNLSELQWEVITRSWRNNLDFWQPEKSWFYRTVFFGVYWMYVRWKHGQKATKPMMKLVGFDDDSMTMKLMEKFRSSNGRIGANP